MRKLTTLLIAASFLTLSSSVLALGPGDKVDNFKLIDHTGKMHELHYLSDMKAVVLMVHGNGCPIARNALHTYKDLREQYKNKDIAFLMINSNLQDNRKSIAKEAEEFGIDFPILVDDTQIIGESLKIERTADTYVIDPQSWKIMYRGSLDDRLGYETQKKKAANNYVADALDELLAGKPITLAATEAKGCIVNLPELDRHQAHAKISYAEDIAPVLINKCVSCHRDGGIGPFAMNDYNTIKGFSPMIREVVRTKRMPPWHADPHIGEYSNDRALSDQETQNLVHWIEAGSPRGDGQDPLATMQHDWPQWAFGEPDAVINIPASDVPATGVVDYKYIDVTNPLDNDVWLSAVQVLPGAREVLHHAVIAMSGKTEEGRMARSSLPGYAPGDAGYQLPPETGILLPKGATIQFQMHYTTYGKTARDESRYGLYFHKEKPKYELQTQYMANPGLKIPAGEKEYWDQSTITVRTDMMLYSLIPHSHFRGKAASFTATYPDGKEEVLLSVPNYDFNWQSTYFFEQPKVLPKGTKVTLNMAWDNSELNPANPDPTIEVRWGEQSWEEMLFGALRYREMGPDELNRQELSSAQ